MDRPNVIFIVMDTARAQNALPSENPTTTPCLSQIAEDGVEFTNTISTAPWTLPSHASMFTGKYTSNHKTNAGNKQFSPNSKSLPERIQSAGYTTVGFSNNTWISPELGFDRGFDEFYKGWQPFPNSGILSKAMRNHDATSDQIRELLTEAKLTEIPATLANAVYARFIWNWYDCGATITNWRVKQWFSSEYEPSDPFFMFINYLEPHLKYDAPKKFCRDNLPQDVSVSEAKQVQQNPWQYIGGNLDLTEDDFRILESLYDAEIQYLDYRIGKLYKYLLYQDILDNTLLVIVGDHGENVGDHGLMDHQYCLYDTLIRVPLVIRAPELFCDGKKVSAMVESRDLYPTILEVIGENLPKEDSISKHSLCSVVRGEPHSRQHAISEYLVPQPDIKTLQERAGTDDDFEEYNRALRSIRTDCWKYIVGSDGSEYLYDLERDPTESINRASKHSAVVNELQTILQEKLGSLEQGKQDSATLSGSTQQRLEDLGYI